MAEAIGLASSVIAVAELSVKVCSLCLQYSRDVKNAKDDIERLSKEVAAFQATTKELQTLVEGPRGKELKASQQLVSAIEDGRSRLEKLEQQLQPSTGRKRMSRFGLRALKWPFESKEVKETIEDLECCRGTISLALKIDQTVILQNVDNRTALSQLPIAHGASFDSKAEEHNPTCLSNTREELLKKIDCWVDDPKSKTIFWLNGMAGTGKSTISRTVARSRSRKGDLGASFFFKRGEMDRGNLNKFMSTLAHQLALSIPGVAFFIKKTLDANLAIVGKSVKEQFEKLIQEPLSEAAATTTTPSSVVIVIDALDECDQEADIRLLINIISQAKIVRPQLRVFLTSRPELPIRLAFSEVQGSYQDLVLHDIAAQIVEHDIFVFLDDEFQKIRHEFNLTVCDERKLPSDWPGRPTVQRLAQMAVPLFIFAATICRFIGDRKRDSPPIQLRKVLDYKSKGHVSQLDLTYGPVLRSLITDVSGDDRKQIINDFKMIVGSIVILANPISAWALSQLLEVDPEVVENRLDTLHSVLSIPLERTIPVRLLHLSFRDYLITEESDFRVDERHTHQTLAKHCLRIMRGGLRKNICGLSFPGMRQSAVDLRQLEKSMPSQLQYACMHWVYHQMESDPKLDDDNGVYDFLTTHFLHWLEVMSLLGRVKECLDSLRSLARWLENREDSSLSAFVADAVRFLQAYFPVIAEAPLQIYSCLGFTPGKSVVRRTFESVIPKWISSLPKVEENWDACLLTLEGHGDKVRSVVFSYDSTKVASGSHDKTIRIWDAETGECKRVLEGHGSSVSSVVFSYDSKKVASASDDKTIRIWDAETSECKRVLKGHGSSVSSVVFSHDSKKVASGSYDETIRIWNPEKGECERVLKGHGDLVRSVVFSHDSTKVASSSHDKTIRIWNAETGECERVLKGHGDLVSSVVFSHDSTKVASGSLDKTIRIWDTETGECKRVLEGHKNDVMSLVFSHDSTKVASGSWDKTIRIWNAEKGECERVLKGHGSSVSSVVFSHESKKVASGSLDKTIRIWDGEIGKCERVLEGHSDWVSSVVFSYDSKKVASASDDKTIRIWNAETSECERVLEGHKNDVMSLVFSHDSTKVASGSWDKTIRIWNAETGECERVLKGHGSSVSSVVFSHNSKKVASGSLNYTIRIWNAEKGKCERVLEGHSGTVSSVVFSYDSKRVASGSYDETIRIWDPETGECDRVLEGHSDFVRSVVFSHDSKKVASSSDDETIRIWDAETGECNGIVPVAGYVKDLSFTPDGHGIVTNLGVFLPTSGSQSNAGSAMPWQSSDTPILACTNSTWVTAAGKDLLWLPPECRNGQVAVSGSTVAIGCQSGRVVLLGISMAAVELWTGT
ncbi:Vegetative incompatibility protein HET-E-1 [Fusarium oxysporum f. sp. rapae]|uniref:Vegetative incompatibility protein HET-E-1 n=1 Tax=Fusarium oxysporum f. sp. rapae TaxID=485398 RepID=A0A8J5NGS7_FUSOX|nr:Vegetative incompatibility protein HET-E-1 [Fusarium oxysporum f. sp. rapae]